MRRIQRTVAEVVAGKRPPQVDPDTSVGAAARLMHESHSGCVLVVDGSRLVGIFTERDYLNRVAALGRTPSKILMAEVMTPNPETLHLSDCITYAINKMAVGGFRNVPILDECDRPVAVLTIREILEHLVELFGEMAIPDADADASRAWIDIGGG